VFKKASKIAVTFCLLVGAYAGYTRLFAVITRQLGVVRQDLGGAFPEFSASASSVRAAQLARETFGKDHFAAGDELKLQYYDAVRGFYMYAQNKKISTDNKQIHVWPFALIWISKDGQSRKTATSDEAWIDLNQPFIQVKPSAEPAKITHARLGGNVRLGDDKGTLNDPTDDLKVGPLTSVEFDDATLQITTDSDIYLQDRDLTLTGIGMMIQLRRKVATPSPEAAAAGTPPPPAPTGFDAETAFVYKDVHIVVNDVRSDGVLPGTAKPEKTGKTPIDVRSDREMRIDLPRPRAKSADDKSPPDPTLVKFRTNVRVLRGTDKSDQLNCDTLDLTFLPKTKKPLADPAKDQDTTAAAAASKPTDGPMTELEIKTAHARGDAVWLQSEAQGMVARCVELIYEKHSGEGLPDVTYLNGGFGKKMLRVEKVDYDAKAAPGTIKSVMVMTALDATIFDSGPGGSNKVIARGPGKTEERPARNAPVARTVWWEDEMEMLTWSDGEVPTPTPSPLAVRALSTRKIVPAKGTLRRLLTLSGVAKLVDHETSTILDARKSIVAEFQSVPNPAPSKGYGPAEIKWLDAYEDAHLTAPSKALTARQFLKAKFETLPKPAPPALIPGLPAGPIIAAVAPPPAPAPAEPKPEPQAKLAPAEPLVDGRAERVWASILLGSNVEGVQGQKGELRDAQLRGNVMVHQDPKPGQPFGSDASGEALDLTSQGNGLMKFAVKAEEPPQAGDPKTRLASDSKGRKALNTRIARVFVEGKTVESDDVIGVDQKLDFMWVQGSGVYTQETDRGLLDDKGIEGEKAKAGAKPLGPNPKDKLLISWTTEMQFYGKSFDLEGRPAAKVEFRGTSKEVRTPDGRREFRRGVETRMTDSAIFTDSMDVYMDRTIAFNKDARKPAAKPAEGDEPRQPEAQIAMLDCKGKDLYQDAKLKYPGVDIISQKILPDSTEIKEKQRIQGQHVIYDKRTGNFYAPGAGLAWLYRRKGGDSASKPDPTLASVRPVSAASTPNGRAKPEAVLVAKKAPLPPLELTKIKFFDGMRGRFGVAKDQQADNERREAEFYGSVQAANATVSTANSDIDFDHLSKLPDATYLTSDVLDVFSEPMPIGSNSKATNRQLLNARGNATARVNFDLIQADRITFNSGSGLAYAYGDDGKEVSITKSDSFGQAPTVSRGRTALYNKETKQAKLDDPAGFTFVDLKSGIRSKPFFPDLGGSPKPLDPKKLPRVPLQRQSRNANERSSFNGH
jgi:hypothetical protein